VEEEERVVEYHEGIWASSRQGTQRLVELLDLAQELEPMERRSSPLLERRA